MMRRMRRTRAPAAPAPSSLRCVSPLLVLIALTGPAEALRLPPPPHCARARNLVACEGAALLTLAEVEDAAREVGCEIKINAVGPKFRLELLWEGGKALPAPRIQTLGYQDDSPPPPELLGYCDGFTQPSGATHLEAIEIRKYTGFWARKKESGAKRYAATKPLQPGILLAHGTACWIREKGPFSNAKAQLLCIKDDERQQRPLIRFYRRLGFKTLREIGSGLQSVPDRIVWGGEGTVMEIDIDVMRQSQSAGTMIIRGLRRGDKS